MLNIPFMIIDIIDFIENNKYHTIIKLNNINVKIVSNLEAEQVEFIIRDNRGDETVCVIHMNADVSTLVDELHVMIINHQISELYTKEKMVNEIAAVLV